MLRCQNCGRYYDEGCNCALLEAFDTNLSGMAERIYESLDVVTATGRALDLLGEATGLLRPVDATDADFRVTIEKRRSDLNNMLIWWRSLRDSGHV